MRSSRREAAWPRRCSWRRSESRPGRDFMARPPREPIGAVLTHQARYRAWDRELGFFHPPGSSTIFDTVVNRAAAGCRTGFNSGGFAEPTAQLLRVGPGAMSRRGFPGAPSASRRGAARPEARGPVDRVATVEPAGCALRVLRLCTCLFIIILASCNLRSAACGTGRSFLADSSSYDHDHMLFVFLRGRYERMPGWERRLLKGRRRTGQILFEKRGG